MNRRQILKNSAITLAALKFTTMTKTQALAQETGTALVVNSNISNNHGHALKLNLEDLVLLLRQAKESSGVDLSIQGQSHPHNINLKLDDFLQSPLGEVIRVESSEDFGHTHVVEIHLEQNV